MKKNSPSVQNENVITVVIIGSILLIAGAFAALTVYA